MEPETMITKDLLIIEINLHLLPKDSEGVIQTGPAVAEALRRFANDYENKPRRIEYEVLTNEFGDVIGGVKMV